MMDTANGATRAWKRHRLVVDPLFQWGAVGVVAVAVLFSALVGVAAAVWIHLFMGARAVVVDHNLAVLQLGGGAAVLLAALFGWILLKASHRVAGPVWKISRVLREAAAGADGAVPLRLRDGDRFQGLADSANFCLAILRQERTTRREAFDRLDLLREAMEKGTVEASEAHERILAVLHLLGDVRK